MEVTSVWREILTEFKAGIEFEERKYPMSERDTLIINTIVKILDNLEYVTRR